MSQQEDDRLVRLLRETRADTLTMLEGIDNYNLPLSSEEGSGWLLRDLIAHVTAWDLACAEAVRAYVEEDETNYNIPNFSGVHAFNDREVQKRMGLPIKQVIADWKAARETFVVAVAAAPPEMRLGELRAPWGPRTTLSGLVEGIVGHERAHHLDIRRALRARRRG
jgi:hypothetical protein